jgi:hypothetical protein
VISLSSSVPPKIPFCQDFSGKKLFIHRKIADRKDTGLSSEISLIPAENVGFAEDDTVAGNSPRTSVIHSERLPLGC